MHGNNAFFRSDIESKERKKEIRNNAKTLIFQRRRKNCKQYEQMNKNNVEIWAIEKRAERKKNHHYDLKNTKQ